MLKPASARIPTQTRSRQRLSLLLDATATLLESREIAEIGLYDIARAAAVPPASAYHLLPSKEAAFLALAERYLADLQALADAPITPGAIRHWSDLIRIRAARTVGFYEKNPVAAKLFLSGSILAEIRAADLDFVSRVSALSLAWMDRSFVMPYLAEAEMKFTTLIAIFDGVWTTSYGRHGRITEAFAEEACRAALAYCRSFLPEVIAQRAPNERARLALP